MSVPKRKDADARNSAAQMADAMDYLCRIAAEEGLDCVLCDLRVVRDKLQLRTRKYSVPSWLKYN